MSKKVALFTVVSLVSLAALLFAFIPKMAPVVGTETAIPSVTPIIPTETQVFISPTVPPTDLPSATPMPEAQQKIRAIMVAYGHVDEKYLTPTYWEKLSADVEKYGPAQRILALEFHGDYYNMYGGAYRMDPDSFYEQMEYLMKNNYHFVTGPELIGFLEGWLQLPARSVILTTDSGAGSINSMPRIIEDFQKLEREYGYTPHMQSFIWTYGMTPEESIRCVDDICWKSFREYLESGYFTFGSHTETHGDFGKFDRDQTIWDLTTNTTKIRENLGLNVYGLTWPFEACSPYNDLVSAAGIKYAYGGWSRGMNQNYTYFGDNMPLCLPRLFPANPDGLSGRPNGFTFEDMLNFAQKTDYPLK